ncbi:MAG: FtsX-like permease family protein [Ignavibacteria bacterium]|nr:FtsX-like permease family protein [Ignavibacteria bacterium]
MEFKELLTIALTSIRANKLRSILTLLGIVVGVFSIIAVMTAMGVLQSTIEKDLSDLGANTFQVQKFPVNIGGGGRDRSKFRNRKNITYEQGIAVKERATLAEYVGVETLEYGRTVRTKRYETNPSVTLFGENTDGLITNNWIPKDGRGISEDDIEYARNNIVLGARIVQKIFPHENPVDATVQVDGRHYRVIGVLEEKGSSLGGNQDNQAIIPITTFMRYYGKERSFNIMVKAQSQQLFTETMEQVRSQLRNIRRVAPSEEDDFAIFSNDSLIDQFNDFTKYVKYGILFISSIALLAAGIGIMNIMLVSVTERTREIGIRKALGARKRDILRQFIIEAVILSEIGGMVGVFLGILGGNIVALLMETSVVIPFDWAIIGLLICSFVGIVFGVYPAWKASKLVPIEALRYE